MKKIKKFIFMRMMQVFEEKGCKTIEDIKILLNKELKNEDVVFSWREGN